MKLAIFCMVILCLVAAKVRHGPQYMWTIRADTFVHRTFEEGSPDAHYYYLKLSRAELMYYAENVHVIVNEISDPDADIKLYIKPNSREELLDLTAEGIQEYRTLHAELILDSPPPPVSKYSVAVVCKTPGVEYSISACLGEDCSETSTSGLKAQPRHPMFPKPIRKKVEDDKKHNREMLQKAAKEAKGTTEKRAFPPPPEEIMSPTAAVSPVLTQAFNAPEFSIDKSGFDGGAFLDGDEFAASCGLIHSTGFTGERSFIQSPFDVNPKIVTYDFGDAITMTGFCFWAGESARSRVITANFYVSTDNITYTAVLTDEMIPPVTTNGVPEPGISINLLAPVEARYVRINATMVGPQGVLVIGEFAARVIPDEPPIVPICEGSNCQCNITGCAAPIAACPACAVNIVPCDSVDRGLCDVISEVNDTNGFPINQGPIDISGAAVCTIIDTVVQSVTGITGRNCIILTEKAEVVEGITGGPRPDCILNEGGTVFGIINLGGGDDCYIGTDASTGRINGQGGDDFIIVNGGDTSSLAFSPQQLNGGAADDCISVSDGAFVGLINGAVGDDCVFIGNMAETARIRGQAGNDHLSVSMSVVASIDGQEGDDIIEVDMGSEVDGPIAGGMGFDEVYVMGSDVNGNITTATEDDIVVVEGPLANFDTIDTGDGNDCIEVRMASSLFEIEAITGGLGDDNIYAIANDRIGNIRGNEGCDTVVSCNNGANQGGGPIDTVDGGPDIDRCVVNAVLGAEEVLECETNTDVCDMITMPVVP